MQTDTRSTNLWKKGGWMALACLVPLVALAAILAFQIPLSIVALFGIVLICPALHFFMMRNHGHGAHQEQMAQPVASSHGHDVQG